MITEADVLASTGGSIPMLFIYRRDDPGGSAGKDATGVHLMISNSERIMSVGRYFL